MSDIDPARIRRECLRWYLLLAIYNARPGELAEAPILATARAMYPDSTQIEVRRELDYLSDRGLVDLRKTPDGVWWSNLTRYGTDIVEYTIDCEPGIARPVKYW